MRKFFMKFSILLILKDKRYIQIFQLREDIMVNGNFEDGWYYNYQKNIEVFSFIYLDIDVYCGFIYSN